MSQLLKTGFQCIVNLDYINNIKGLMIQVGASHVKPFPRGHSTINVWSLNKKIIKMASKSKG